MGSNENEALFLLLLKRCSLLRWSLSYPCAYSVSKNTTTNLLARCHDVSKIITYACILTIQNMNNEFEMSKVSNSGLVAINLTGFQRLSVYQKWSDFRLKRLNVSSNIYWRVVHLTQTLLGRLHFAFVLIVNRRVCTQTVVAFLISFALKSVFFSI